MKLAALVSGGKDSLYAMYQASKENEISCIISISSENKASYMFHFPNVDLVKEQAKSMNIPLITITTKGIKEEELKDIELVLKKVIKEYKIQGIVTGALYSNYQKDRIDNICKKLNIKSIAPLWHINLEDYLNSLIKDKFKVIITGIAADGFNESWLGKEIDKETISKLKELNRKYSINLGFEGGEAETFVLDCPLFKKRIKILESEKIMENKITGILEIKKIKNEAK